MSVLTWSRSNLHALIPHTAHITHPRAHTEGQSTKATIRNRESRQQSALDYPAVQHTLCTACTLTFDHRIRIASIAVTPPLSARLSLLLPVACCTHSLG